MLCRNCGTEIADKAIVCYRCGTGTTEPVRKPVEIRRRRSPLSTLVILVVIVLVILAALFFARAYHVVGLDIVAGLAAAVDPGQGVAVLIDFSVGHA